MLQLLTLVVATAGMASGALRQAPEPLPPVSLVFGGTDPRGVRVEVPAGLGGPRTLVVTVEAQMLALGNYAHELDATLASCRAAR